MASDTEDALLSLPDLKRKRRIEYAERLPPITDLNLSPAQRPFSEGESPSLHLGFQCILPLAPSSEFDDKLRRANAEVDAKLGVLDYWLVYVPTVHEYPLSSGIVVVAFYINVHKKLKDDQGTRKKFKGVLKALRNAFGEGVEGPKWYWDGTVHGPGAYAYIPFDEAYPSGCPGASTTDDACSDGVRILRRIDSLCT